MTLIGHIRQDAQLAADVRNGRPKLALLQAKGNLPVGES